MDTKQTTIKSRTITRECTNSYRKNCCSDTRENNNIRDEQKSTACHNEVNAREKKRLDVMHIISLVIRVITIPPVIALLMLTYLYFYGNNTFLSLGQYGLTVLFICGFSVAAYPLQPLFRPRFQGREGQRHLAMIFAVSGYLLGFIVTLLTDYTNELLFIYLGYLISGSFIWIINKLVHFKLSGHAVGTAGPIAILLGLGYSAWIAGLPILACAFYASLRTKRHTTLQFVSGLLLPFAVCIVLNIFI